RKASVSCCAELVVAGIVLHLAVTTLCLATQPMFALPKFQARKYYAIVRPMNSSLSDFSHDPTFGFAEPFDPKVSYLFSSSLLITSAGRLGWPYRRPPSAVRQKLL